MVPAAVPAHDGRYTEMDNELDEAGADAGTMVALVQVAFQFASGQNQPGRHGVLENCESPVDKHAPGGQIMLDDIPV